ncbi:MAG: FAD-dependent oxidoreductase, partial [Dehalococcoidia bacterium]
AQATPSSRPTRIGADKSLLLRDISAAGKPEVIFMPGERRVVVEAGRSLLEVAESNNLRIEAGCRLGVCGADPVAVLTGMENLAQISEDEQNTLERLGLAQNTRMACSARVHGPCTISLTPERPKELTESQIFNLKVDTAIANVVIIGNGIAGVTAADHVRRRHPRCEIHLIAMEKYHLYNRIAIERLIYGRSAMQGLYLQPDNWYDDLKITCWLNTRALRIDRDARTVVLGTGEALSYDRLILATGSSSVIPAIDGFGIEGSFVLRQAEDALRMRAFAQEYGCRRAVVAGGGLLGLEAAYALYKLGLRVSVLERSEWLLRRQLDARGAQFLREYLEGLGVEILVQADTTAVTGNGRVQEVLLKDGRTLPCDLFLAAAGITPNIDLARDAGLDVKRGVVVDDRMCTSAAGIYAAGDVAEYRGQVYGLWPVAGEQAQIAAINALGGDKLYKGVVPVTILKVVGVDLMSVGNFQPEAEGDLVIAFEDTDEHRYRKLVISGGKLVGAILLGYPLDATLVSAAVKKGVDVTPALSTLQSGDWSVLSTLK